MQLHPLTPDEYRTLTEHAPVMIWRAGPDARCNYVNETWVRFTGRPAAEELRTGLEASVHPDDAPRRRGVFLEHFARRASFEIEYRLRHRDGSYRWVLDRGTPFTAETGEFAGFVGSCVDVQARRDAEHARSEFLTVVAHELRTPLQAMKTYLDVVQRKAQRGEALTPDMFRKVSSQIARFSALVGDLGDASRIEQGRSLSMAREIFDLCEVVDHVAALQRATLGARGPRGTAHTLDVDARDRPLYVLGDPGRLEQVMLNLLENAVKFSPAGGAIRVTLARRGGEIRLAVADSGIGIPEAELPRLGQRFFRASNAPAALYPGTGMGLAIIGDIVEAHGGRLDVSSTVGVGTTMTITLPEATA